MEINSLKHKCIKVNQDLCIVLADHLLKTQKELKNLKKLEIEDIFIKKN